MHAKWNGPVARLRIRGAKYEIIERKAALWISKDSCTASVSETALVAVAAVPLSEVTADTPAAPGPPSVSRGARRR